MRKVDLKEYGAVFELFDRFQGVDLGNKKPFELFIDWTITIKGINLFSTLFPTFLREEDALTDLMTDLSLHIWGYQKKR